MKRAQPEVTKPCEVCGATVHRTNKHGQRQWAAVRFCSVACSDIGKTYHRRQGTVVDYLLKNSMPEPNSGCWLWLAAHNGLGYGVLFADGRQQYAHRLSIEHIGGKSVGDLVVCHRCDNPWCINPDHLFIGTMKDNQQDSKRKGRNGAQKHPELWREIGRTLAQRRRPRAKTHPT